MTDEETSEQTCPKCEAVGTLRPASATLIRKVRFIKVPFSRGKITVMECSRCGYFEE